MSRPTSAYIRQAAAEGRHKDISRDEVIGSGANGMVNLHDLVVGDHAKLAAMKRCDLHEFKLMQRLTGAQESKAGTHIPTLLHAEYDPQDFSHAGGGNDYKMYLSACELGSLRDQKLYQKLTDGDIDPSTYLRYVFQVLLQVNTALQHSHSEGILHLDIKPGNIFIDATGHAFLGDFGQARECPTGEHIPLAKRALVDNGTIQFITPEVFIGPSAYKSTFGDAITAPVCSAQTDIWALGVTIGTLLGPKYETGLLTSTQLKQFARDRVLPQDALIRAANAAVSKNKVEAKIDWTTQSTAAMRMLHDLLDKRDTPFNRADMLSLLTALTQWMCAPLEFRPNSSELADTLRLLAPYVPKVHIDIGPDDEGNPRIATIKNAAAATASAVSAETTPEPEAEPSRAATPHIPSPVSSTSASAQASSPGNKGTVILDGSAAEAAAVAARESKTADTEDLARKTWCPKPVIHRRRRSDRKASVSTAVAAMAAIRERELAPIRDPRRQARRSLLQKGKLQVASEHSIMERQLLVGPRKMRCG